MKNLEKYLSTKFQRPITKLSKSPSLVFNYDNKRLLKLEKYYPNKLALCNYIIKEGKDLPIAKIYSVGKIQLPKHINYELKKEQSTEYIFHIMEKVDRPTDLVNDLWSIDGAIDEINEYYNERIIGHDSAVLYDLSNYIQEGDLSRIFDIQNYFKEKEPELHELVIEISNIIIKLGDNNIWWNDVHSGQFGYNNKGELVAFDLDGLDIEREELYRVNNYIRENIQGKIKRFTDMGKENKIIKNFIKGLKHEIKETDDLRKIFSRYVSGGKITEEEKKFVKQQSTDILRMLGLSAIVPLPGSSVIIPSLIFLAKKVGVELLPKGFRLDESMSEEEIIDIIQDGKKVFVKYIYDYDKHDKEKGYLPVDIDGEDITLEIDGDLYYTKMEYIEGIEENQQFFLSGHETEPLDTKTGEKPKEYWEEDEEFRELLKDQGGRKGVIKKMKKIYDLDYSKCKTEDELYQSLKADKMI